VQVEKTLADFMATTTGIFFSRPVMALCNSLQIKHLSALLGDIKSRLKVLEDQQTSSVPVSYEKNH
jgi:hypothetical protein